MRAILLLLLGASCCIAQTPLTVPPALAQPLDISGRWYFRLDPHGDGLPGGWQSPETDREGWRPILVPTNWESQGYTDQLIDEYGDWNPYNGVAWYRRRIELPEEWRGRLLQLDLGRIDDQDITFWNGITVGKSDTVDVERAYRIQPEMAAAENVLVVRVLDIGGDGGIFPGPVQIRAVMPWEDTGLSCRPDAPLGVYEPGQAATLSIEAKNVMDRHVPARLEWSLCDPDGRVFAEGAEDDWPLPPGGSRRQALALEPMPEGHYDARVTLRSGELVLKETMSSFAVMRPAGPGWNDPGSPFALNAGALFHLTDGQLGTEGPKRLAHSAMLGASWGRNDFWWSVIERERGIFDWTRADAAVEMYRAHGINLMVILSYASAWSGGFAPADDEERAAFAAYTKALVQRYKGRVACWEVWNEPNITEFWKPVPSADDYAKLLGLTYRTVKEADPDATVVGCATAGTDLTFIRRVLELGGGAHMDVCSVHPYQGEPAASGGQYHMILTLRRMLEEAGHPMPIWITEMGWPTVGGMTERRQADFVAKLYVTSVAGEYGRALGKVFYFNLGDWGPRGTGIGGHFGLAHMDNTPKPSFVAYATVRRMLAGAEYAREVDLGPGVAAVEFERAGERIVVAWAESDGAVEVTVPRRGQVVARDVFGRPLPAEADEAGARLSVGPSPVYLTTAEPSGR